MFDAIYGFEILVIGDQRIQKRTHPNAECSV
jgi:hypothetical protein